MHVRDLIGLSWKEDGRELDGLNCWGLCRIARRELEGKDDLPSYLGEYKVPLRYRELEKLIAQEKDLNWQKIELGKEHPGDLILWIKRGFATHVAYVTRPGWMLHIEEQTLSVHVRYPTLEHPVDHIEGIYRYG